MTAPGWRPAPGERSVRFSPVWFRLIDDLTGLSPAGRVLVRLDRQEGTEWKPTEVPATVTMVGMVAFPGLGRRRETAGVPAGHYRVRAEAEFYRPLYREQAEGLEFGAPPNNDDIQPPAPARMDMILLPSVTYPYPAHIRTLRGIVHDQAGVPVGDVLVQTQSQAGPVTRLERTLTDDRGAFTLALRWVAPGSTASVTATDRRGHRSAIVTVTVPDDLDHSQLIVIA
jgi:hypothetical protein